LRLFFAAADRVLDDVRAIEDIDVAIISNRPQRQDR